MKIAIFGAGGRIGSRVVIEALNRGHNVTAVVRHPENYILIHDHLSVAKGDLFDDRKVESAAFDHDAAVSAYSNTNGAPPSTIAEVVPPLIKGLKQAHVKRLIIVGVAGSLKVASGGDLVDTPDFPQAYKAIALAHRDAFKLYQKETGLDWTYISPAAVIEPGQRTGKFRVGTDELIVDAQGRSFITMEDYAVAVVDEIENPLHLKARMTVGY